MGRDLVAGGASGSDGATSSVRPSGFPCLRYANPKAADDVGIPGDRGSSPWTAPPTGGSLAMACPVIQRGPVPRPSPMDMGCAQVYGSFSHGLRYGIVHVPEEVQLIWV